MTERHIRTAYVGPMPVREGDWQAWTDNDEETVGTGCTADEAISDLTWKLDVREGLV